MFKKIQWFAILSFFIIGAYAFFQGDFLAGFSGILLGIAHILMFS